MFLFQLTYQSECNYGHIMTPVEGHHNTFHLTPTDLMEGSSIGISNRHSGFDSESPRPTVQFGPQPHISELYNHDQHIKGPYIGIIE